MKHHLGAAIGELRFEPVPVQLRALLDGQPVLTSSRAVLVWEPRRLVPVYAVPVDDVVATLTAGGPETQDLTGVPAMLGPEDFGLHTTPGTVMDLSLGSRFLQGAGFVPADEDLAGLVVLDFAAFDAWWAEDEPLVAHPHDPFKRIDVLATSRRVTVSLHGTELASTSRALMLLETHLPVRYYLPADDVRTDLLEPSETRSECAYKGVASYLSTRDGSEDGRDLAWHYPEPLDDALRVRDRICFWAERTDLVVDDEPVTRPITPWSRPEEQAGADADQLQFG